MTDILYQYDLSAHNTMALSSVASQAVFIRHVNDLAKLPSNLPFFILSGGSNVLLPATLDATVLLPAIHGITLIEETDETVIIDVACAENWHELVVYCTEKGWYGLENLALIPGLAGAAPIQNIGAYGVQLDDRLLAVHCVDLESGHAKTLTKADCNFAYRDSIFKHSHKQHFITAIRLALHKDPQQVNTNYGDLAARSQELAEKDGLSSPTPHHVMQAVIAIRSEKLPDPKILPNCGSFFKNPIISHAQFDTLKNAHPTLPSYPADDGVKVPAGWLIDKAGLKGGGVAPILTHKHQALVLTNHAPHHATQADIKAATDFIIETVFETFAIRLEREPVWVNEQGQF